MDDHVLDWLLDGDPAIRWQVLRDLTDAPDDQVAAERRRVATEGWGAQLLALRGADGQWAGGACFPGWVADAWRRGEEPQLDGQPWTATLPTLALMRRLGLDPDSEVARETTHLVAEHCRWEHDGQRFFDGEVEECINGQTLAVGAYLGVDMAPLVQRLLEAQLADGGWNCESERGASVGSFHSTICVLEGLVAWARSGSLTPSVGAAVARGHEYLLERALFRGRRSGEVVDESWLQFSFPPQWSYDVLRALDHLREAGAAADDPRLADALDVVRRKRQPDGRWLLEHTHPGEQHLVLEDGDGRPSRWNTLRALRVLRWADRA